MRKYFTALLLIFLAFVHGTAFSDEFKDERTRATKLQSDGNYKEAFEIFEKITLSKDNTSLSLPNDYTQALNCLRNLNLRNNVDSFREKAIAVHSNRWRLLNTAAYDYLNGEHGGYVISGDFRRGGHSGGGRYVISFSRDRVRSLQLYQQAENLLLTSDTQPHERGNFYLAYAEAFRKSSLYGYNDWKLQVLTDLSETPDYDEYQHGYPQTRGAPVDEEGNPVYYEVPDDFESARNDGERWRWLLAKAVRVHPALEEQIQFTLAGFYQNQFGVQTMRDNPYYFRVSNRTDSSKQHSFSLHTLSDEETIAKLATGIKRFTLKKQFNHIALYEKLAANESKTYYAGQALEQLATIFENRRQYAKAAKLWRKSIKTFGVSNHKTQRLDSIVKNWGKFEVVGPQVAGEPASVEFVFRNASKVTLTAHEVNLEELITATKNYIKASAGNFDWSKGHLQNLGHRLVNEDAKRFVGEQAAHWNLSLKPADNHFDRRITIETPLKKQGLYLLTATLPDGNTSNILLWINSLVMVKKILNDGTYYFVGDAKTGKPVANADVEFFGYRWINHDLLGVQIRKTATASFAEKTDLKGQLFPDKSLLETNHQWLGIARGPKGGIALLNFSNVWYNNYYDYPYDQYKPFVITDRPVYRPGHDVKFKFWVRRAKYELEDVSTAAGQSFQVIIRNPQNEDIYTESFTADNYGGIEGHLKLGEEADLGSYSIGLSNHGPFGSFRVEEYKKPEFEVTVEVPEKPLELGDTFTANIVAKYFFGAPVTEAKVSYKVYRKTHDLTWYPYTPWDWLYGVGYWWFAYDYDWYPGWRSWGCKRPFPWWGHFSAQPPELVQENEVEIGEDGQVRVTIDTALAKAIHGDSDHKYEIVVEVTDSSRRTIVGKGELIAARSAFRVYTWVNRGHYRVGEAIKAQMNARSADGKPVSGKGVLKLYRIGIDTKGEAKESLIEKWDVATGETGLTSHQLSANTPGQYRLSYTLDDGAGHTAEGGYIFTVMGDQATGNGFQFSELELIPDRQHYAPGDTLRLRINTDQKDSTVVLFSRPVNGTYLKPEVIRLKGKSVLREIDIEMKDMPNIFFEAFTIHNGQLFSTIKEVVIPPEKRVLNVEVLPSEERYLPGEQARVKVKVTDSKGQPFSGALAMTVYDKSVEYISGGSNVPDMKEFFWKWRRTHNANSQTSLDVYEANISLKGMPMMQALGVFGDSVADDEGTIGGKYSGKASVEKRNSSLRRNRGLLQDGRFAKEKKGMSIGSAKDERSEAFADEVAAGAPMSSSRQQEQEPASGGAALVQPEVRKNFADTAYWNARMHTDADGIAETDFPFPESLTTWVVKTWALGHGTKVGEGSAEVITSKNLILRLQAPRFFVQKDEVVLSANVHNYLEAEKSVQVQLSLPGDTIQSLDELTQTVTIAPHGEKRVDWRVKVLKEGDAVVRMSALTDEESDAMEMKFPVFVHGIEKVESFSGVVYQGQETSSVNFSVPQERREEDTSLELRYSPSVASAMVDALPYLVSYPYGCTEQTLSRFLPTVITQKILQEMGLDLEAIRTKRSNLNAQEVGDDTERSKQWKHFDHNPVFDEAEVSLMVKTGLKRLTAMQNTDGGWGWFSGTGEYSYPHTTAYVVHGLQLAKQNGLAIVPGVLENGVRWLKSYQDSQVTLLKNKASSKDPYKTSADNQDAFIYMVLVDADVDDQEMRDFLYRDRTQLAVYGKAMLGIALQQKQQTEKLQMILRNIDQFLVQDDENQTAYLNIQAGGYWWYWYGNEVEANAYYLKLLSRSDPGGKRAKGLAKYLINNRKHATYWNSTRDTAVVIEALADFITASGENDPSLTVEVFLDGKKLKETTITKENLFTFDNKVVLTGDEVRSGSHKLEVRSKGKGTLYYNAYLTYFSLEDFITKAGLEIKVDRKFYKLVRDDKTVAVAGSRGQAVGQRVEKYRRVELANHAVLQSGDLVEVELTIQSKNDYEYLVFEDMKAAGFEPVEVRSGYNGNDMHAYVEFRDEKVAFFVRQLARGKHSVSYRLRAEIPGTFSALPTLGSAMYAPELRTNSDEMKVGIKD